MDVTESLILTSLSGSDLEGLQSHLKLVDLERGDALYSPGHRFLHAYFCLDGTVSMGGLGPDGQFIQAGMVGREGFAGLPILLGDTVSSSHAVVQVSGRALRISAPLLKAAVDWSGTLRDSLNRYTTFYLAQVSRTAVCNRCHSLEARLARWILCVQDAVGIDELALRQEDLAQMLGAQRPSVTTAARAMKQMGIIDYTRGSIVVQDRARLCSYACNCYGDIRRERDRLIRAPAMLDGAAPPARAFPWDAIPSLGDEDGE